MTFTLQGLSKVYFCTGARNHSLLSILEKSIIEFKFDERAASFMALGLGKISNAPVAICTTSGTAVAECIPAMLEALYSKVPLVLISGDRPKKLHNTGSPQTIDHEALTKCCRGSYVEVNLKEFQKLEITNPIFPLHINVLIDDTLAHDSRVDLDSSLNDFKTFLVTHQRPVFLFSHEEKSMRLFIKEFTSFKLPFYAETLSGARDLSDIKHEIDLITLIESDQFDSIVRIGHTPLSKLWRQLEKSPIPVFSFDNRKLPALSFGKVCNKSSEELLNDEHFWKIVKEIKPNPFKTKTRYLTSLISKYPHSEMSLLDELQKLFTDEDIIYLGNSLSIRFFEMIQRKELNVHGNRGVNGIDGQLATAIGMAHGTKKNVYCILGDITTFYDLSSIKDIPANLKLIIMNNKGGRIFDVLKLDKRFILEHEEHFEAITKALGKSYTNNLFEFKESQVLELFPLDQDTKNFLSEWNS